MADEFDVVLEMDVLERLIRETPQSLGRMVSAAAEQALTEIKLGIAQSPATGRRYARGKRGRAHIASSPGKPPRIDTSALINSLRVINVGPMTRQIADGVEHGYLMEVGTSRIEPRPFMRPVLDAWRRGKFAEFAAGWGVLR